MRKKMICLAVSLLASLDASAGYIRYDFGGNAEPISGYIIQHDDDGSIADFRFYLWDAAQNFGNGFSPQQNNGRTYIMNAHTFQPGSGPTSFRIYDDFNLDNQAIITVNVLWNVSGTFLYEADYSALRYYYEGWKPLSGSYSGTLSKGTMEDWKVAQLDADGGYEHWVTPVYPRYADPYQVPEPASLALFAAGAIGACAAATRRKARS